jgi:Fe-S cluster assembly protein SufD
MGIRIIPLHQSLEDASWKEIFARWISTPEMSPNKAFEFLNLTFQSTGFFLDIPKNTILHKPVEIQIIHDDDSISFSNPLYFIRCGAGSKAAVLERIEKNADNPSGTTESFVNSIGYIHLDKNASLVHTKWQDLPITQNLVYKLFVTQFRDSRFESFAFDFGGNVVRNNVEAELEEHNTYTSLQAGFMASLRQSMDHQTRINHKVAYCESHELYKGIIDQYSSAAFNGKVFVHKDAQKTNAYQQNDTLVLSNHALMNSKPQLEIYADDVKCSHGATIGQMDEKALFYLKSRGIRPDVARHILKKAFIAQVLDKVPDESIRTYITAQMAMES